jgi:HAD superfamily hydrolase (TIGR01509 family)
MKILSQSSVKAKQVPIISFAGRGTLIHDLPPFEKWCWKYLESRQLRLNPQDLKEKLIQIVEKFNLQAIEAPGMNFGKKEVLRELLSFQFSGKELEEELQLALDTHHTSCKVVIPQFVMDVCEELKKRSYRLVIVSNENSALIDMLRSLQLMDLFEVILLAEDVGVSKPNPEIFFSLFEELDVQATEILHVGDRYATDVLGAQRAGMEAILYDPLSDERLALSRLDVGAEKVVSIEDLRKIRFYREARIISKFEELLEFFQ